MSTTREVMSRREAGAQPGESFVVSPDATHHESTRRPRPSLADAGSPPRSASRYWALIRDSSGFSTETGSDECGSAMGAHGRPWAPPPLIACTLSDTYAVVGVPWCSPVAIFAAGGFTSLGEGAGARDSAPACRGATDRGLSPRRSAPRARISGPSCAEEIGARCISSAGMRPEGMTYATFDALKPVCKDALAMPTDAQVRAGRGVLRGA